MITKLLTDEQVWELLGSPDTPSSKLAAQFGIQPEQLRNIRHSLRKSGWCCRVDYITCCHCGKRLYKQGHGKGRQRYHAECRSLVLKAINARLGQSRWERTDEQTRSQLLGKAHAYSADNQAQTKATASRLGLPWEPWEDELILSRHQSLATSAQQIGRSLYGAMHRRRQLLERQRQLEALHDV